MILLLWCISAITLVNGQEEKPTLQIISGDEAQPGQFPFVGQLFYGSVSQCTVSIIHERWALTAGRCIYDEKTDAKVLVGSLNAKNDTNGQYYKVAKMIPHEDYFFRDPEDDIRKNLVMNDIALIRLSEPILMTSTNVKPIGVANSKTDFSSTDAFIAGFGRNDVLSKNQGQLRSAEVKVISKKECQAFFEYVGDEQLCANAIDGKTACPLDTGGPLFYKGGAGIEIGITLSTVEARNNCHPRDGSKPDPMLFTKVVSYESWIRGKLSAYNDVLA